MNIFNITIQTINPAISITLTGDGCVILVEDFDFSALDESPNARDFTVNITVLERSKRITNFQFKKKLKRTLLSLLGDAINAVTEKNLQGAHTC